MTNAELRSLYHPACGVNSISHWIFRAENVIDTAVQGYQQLADNVIVGDVILLRSPLVTHL